MRTQKRNKQTVWYALLLGEEAVLDEDGFDTGERKYTYSEPVAKPMSVSAHSNYVDVHQFGALNNYDRIIVTCDLKIPVTEQSIFWIDRRPDQGDADYVVRKVSHEGRTILLAMSRIERVSEGF